MSESHLHKSQDHNLISLDLVTFLYLFLNTAQVWLECRQMYVKAAGLNMQGEMRESAAL